MRGRASSEETSSARRGDRRHKARQNTSCQVGFFPGTRQKVPQKSFALSAGICGLQQPGQRQWNNQGGNYQQRTKSASVSQQWRCQSAPRRIRRRACMNTQARLSASSVEAGVPDARNGFRQGGNASMHCHHPSPLMPCRQRKITAKRRICAVNHLFFS